MAVPYSDITPESIKQDILAELSGTVETREGSYANTLVSPAAYQMWLAYQLVPYFLQMAFPDETSGEFIDSRAADFGLYRTEGQRAAVKLQFEPAYEGKSADVPAGTRVYTEDGLGFATTEDAAWSGGVGIAMAQAEAVGRMYNVAAGSVTVMGRNLSGIAGVTNPEAACGGTDEETDAALLARYREHLQRPISSGNRNHYIAWAKEVSGVSFAACVPLWNGPGTVKVIIGGPGMAPVDETVVTDAAAHIEEERPIGAAVTVVSASARAISVTATVTLAQGAAAEEVKTQLTQALNAMFGKFAFGETKLVRYSRCLALLLDCDGVEDYSAFTLDGGQANLSLGIQETPVVGTVTITAGG